MEVGAIRPGQDPHSLILMTRDVESPGLDWLHLLNALLCSWPFRGNQMSGSETAGTLENTTYTPDMFADYVQALGIDGRYEPVTGA